MVKFAIASSLALAALAAGEPIPKAHVHKRCASHKSGLASATGSAVTPVATVGGASPTTLVTHVASSSADATSREPATASDSLGNTVSAATAYKQYLGDGSTGSGWPAMSAWASWDSLVAINKPIMGQCSGGEPANSAAETADVIAAIQSEAKAAGVDPRYVLAIVMQESGGCVRVHTTNYGVRNPGLMQDHDGTGTCNEGGLKNPCPKSEIVQMIKDGTSGTKAGDGLKQVLAQAGNLGYKDGQQHYAAARMYNSGSLAANKMLQCGIATHCYSTDVANRLLGWNGSNSGCKQDPTPSGC